MAATAASMNRNNLQRKLLYITKIDGTYQSVELADEHYKNIYIDFMLSKQQKKQYDLVIDGIHHDIELSKYHDRSTHTINYDTFCYVDDEFDDNNKTSILSTSEKDLKNFVEYKLKLMHRRGGNKTKAHKAKAKKTKTMKKRRMYRK
jgi:hypothetical protein